MYKGVVPVEFGSDALEGAVNIVTDKSRRTFIDASYSYGPFNTHRSNVNLGFASKKGFTASLTAYQNYSDNDYKIKTRYTDLTTSVISTEEIWFRRFHDKYHNEAVIARVGVVGKPWADRLMLGLTYSHEYAQIQNANLMTIVFGGKYRTAEGWTPTLNYYKRNFLLPRLNLDMALRYDIVTTNNVDTLSRTYSWTGDYRQNDYYGEGVATLAEYRGELSLLSPTSNTILATSIFSRSTTRTPTTTAALPTRPPTPYRARLPPTCAVSTINFTDALLYDNYSLQKPGRNFSIKFRYTFSKSN